MRPENHPARRKTQCFTLLLGLLLAGLVQAGALEQLFAPKAELWETWAQHDPASIEQIDHGAWDHFLQTYVVRGKDGINRLPYAKISPADRQLLSNYLSAMQGIAISRYTRKQQLAYWVNLYNATTVNIVLAHYPVASIRDIDISPGLFADGPWAKKVLTIEGQAVSLNDIEHRILRPLWKDPRIHYAVNCASLGCPDLRNRAFSADHMEEELNMAAREYINHPRGVRVEEKSLHVSSIYSWFQRDFGEDDAQVIAHIKLFASPPLQQQLEGIDSITGDDYDWSLNDTQPVQEPASGAEE